MCSHKLVTQNLGLSLVLLIPSLRSETGCCSATALEPVLVRFGVDMVGGSADVSLSISQAD